VVFWFGLASTRRARAIASYFGTQAGPTLPAGLAARDGLVVGRGPAVRAR
jgi:hypothetical protein